MKKILILSVICLHLVFSQSVFAAQIFNGILMTPSQDVFRIEGSDFEFILLDRTEDKFFVMAKDFCGRRAYNSGGRERFDAEDPQSVAHWLNNEFLVQGYTGFSQQKVGLPQEIIDYIDWDHEWECEAGTTTGNAQKPYKTTCGIALLSEDELVKYSNKIGLDDNLSSLSNDLYIGGWILRDVHPVRGQPYTIRTDMGTDRCYTWNTSNDNVAVRPVFWLDESFFKEVRVNLAHTGENVLNMFKEMYTISELKNLYTTSQLYDYFAYSSPISLKVSCEGKELVHFEQLENICAEVIMENITKSDVKGMLMITGYDKLGAAVFSKAYPLTVQSEGVKKKTIEFCDEGTATEYVRISFLKTLPECKTISNSVRIIKK